MMNILRIPNHHVMLQTFLLMRITDAHWNPIQRSDVYGITANTSEYAQNKS